MMLDVRVGAWAGSGGPAAKYYGISDLSSQNASISEDGILSCVNRGGYGKLPFIVKLGTNPWEAVVCAKVVSGNGGLGGIGQTNGWTPIYFSGTSVYSYLNPVAWPMQYIPIGQWILVKGEFVKYKCVFNGSYYECFIFENGAFVSHGIFRPTTTTYCDNVGLETMLGANRGSSTTEFFCDFDLKECYIKIGNDLMWEGVKGAYGRVNG